MSRVTFALIISFSLVYFILHYIKILLKPEEIFSFVSCILRWWSGCLIASSQSVLFLVGLCICSCSTVWFVISVWGIFPTSEVDFQVCDFLSDFFFFFKSSPLLSLTCLVGFVECFFPSVYLFRCCLFWDFFFHINDAFVVDDVIHAFRHDILDFILHSVLDEMWW